MQVGVVERRRVVAEQLDGALKLALSVVEASELAEELGALLQGDGQVGDGVDPFEQIDGFGGRGEGVVVPSADGEPPGEGGEGLADAGLVVELAFFVQRRAQLVDAFTDASEHEELHPQVVTRHGDAGPVVEVTTQLQTPLIGGEGGRRTATGGVADAQVVPGDRRRARVVDGVLEGLPEDVLLAFEIAETEVDVTQEIERRRHLGWLVNEKLGGVLQTLGRVLEVALARQVFAFPADAFGGGGTSEREGQPQDQQQSLPLTPKGSPSQSP